MSMLLTLHPADSPGLEEQSETFPAFIIHELGYQNENPKSESVYLVMPETATVAVGVGAGVGAGAGEGDWV
jgi:hypothetical protein